MQADVQDKHLMNTESAIWETAVAKKVRGVTGFGLIHMYIYFKTKHCLTAAKSMLGLLYSIMVLMFDNRARCFLPDARPSEINC